MKVFFFVHPFFKLLWVIFNCRSLAASLQTTWKNNLILMRGWEASSLTGWLRYTVCCYACHFWILWCRSLGVINFQSYLKVHYKFELMEETLYLTVNLIDRFLAVQSVIRKKLQLVGITAMLLACKYEEVSVPVVEDLILISDKAYTRKEVLEMVS